jgi:DNA polymerase (family 10)
MDNRTIAQCLSEIADILEIKGENGFRIRSYRNAAETVSTCGEDLAGRVARGENIQDLAGIGASMAQKIREIVETGSCAYHRELLLEVPGGLLELLHLPGLGPKGVALVWTKLGVTGIADLEAAIKDGRFRTLPGMKEKKEARILQGIEERRQTSARFLRPPVADTAARLTRLLLAAGATRVEPAGSFRRQRETIGDLDLIAIGGDHETLTRAFTTDAEVKEVLGAGTTKSSVVLRSGLQIDLRFIPEESLGAAMQYFTGSKAHNVALRERAVRRGLKLNEYGLYDVESGAAKAGAREEDVYEALGLAWVPPEMREGRGEIEAAEARALPALVRIEDIQGDLHVHTTESDGRDSLEDMVDAARRRGLRYVAITDHSRAIPSRTNGTGMNEERCLAHLARIRAAQARYTDIRLLAGIEVCILPDGRLDMADEVLAQLDVVVGSLHARFELEREAMTARVVRAFENPHLDIWGHPLARVLMRREPVALDVDAALEAAARHGVAVELNCQPDRLDLPEHLIRTAAQKGARFVISTDSHAVTGFDNLGLGVGQARRGWLGPGAVLNTRPVEEFLAELRRPAVGA